MLYEKPIFRMMGDRSLLVELGDEIAPEINQRVKHLFRSLTDDRPEGVVDLVPCYRSIMILYDPLKVKIGRLRSWVYSYQRGQERTPAKGQRSLRVPVLYGGQYGPDLEWVARHHGVTSEEIVQRHIARTYRVYMIGFMPGHPYLGELSEDLVTPRKATPRLSVAQGSVGIAQKQIVIYPVKSPGGFQIIGRTPLRLFDPDKTPPTYFEMGDEVRFYPITEREWKD